MLQDMEDIVAPANPLPSDPDTLKLAWMPDWSDHTVIVVASGPSAKSVDLASAAGAAQFIVVNDSWKLAPWADILFACDMAWWLKRKGMPDWHGLRVTSDRSVPDIFPNVHRIWADRAAQGLTLDQHGRITWGGNSGFQAINMAAIFGAKKIIMVGFDMTLAHGIHWHPNHGPGLSNPREMTVERWRIRLDSCADQAARAGIQMINCSPISALVKYPKMTLEEALIC